MKYLMKKRIICNNIMNVSSEGCDIKGDKNTKAIAIIQNVTGTQEIPKAIT